MKIEFDYKSLKKDYDKKVIRKFKDMKDRYKNTKGIKTNPLIYTVYIKDFKSFETGFTVIEPGTINKEFYMTKGHKHKQVTKEIYMVLKGKGKLMIQTNKTQIINLKKDKIYIIPQKSGHRLINTGNKKLEVLTIYPKTSGHDYNFKFKKRIYKKLIK